MTRLLKIIYLHNCANDDMFKFAMVLLMPNTEASAPSCTTEEHGETKRHPLVSAAALEKASRLFRAIGEPSRLRLLSRLAQGEMCVTELASCEQESLPTISQRLRVLRAESLIVRRRRGKHVNYALADQHVMDLVFNALAHATESPAAMPGQSLDFEKERTS